MINIIFQQADKVLEYGSAEQDMNVVMAGADICLADIY